MKIIIVGGHHNLKNCIKGSQLRATEVELSFGVCLLTEFSLESRRGMRSEQFLVYSSLLSVAFLVRGYLKQWPACSRPGTSYRTLCCVCIYLDYHSSLIKIIREHYYSRIGLGKHAFFFPFTSIFDIFFVNTQPERSIKCIMLDD